MTRKQVNVLYRAAKENRIACPAWMFDELYTMADRPRGRKPTKAMKRKDAAAVMILDAVLSGEDEEAQELVRDYAEAEFRHCNKRRDVRLIGRPEVKVIEDLKDEHNIKN